MTDDPDWEAEAEKREGERDAAQHRIDTALGIAEKFGGCDGGHHKMWTIDQMVRALTGSGYDDWVRAVKSGEDGPETYDWDEGIPP